VLGWLTVLLAVSTSLLLATALRLASLVSTLLAAYLVLVADAVVVTIALSPFRAVTPAGLAACEGAALLGALAVWWLRGRPAPPLGSAGASLAAAARSPLALGYLALTVAVLGYELLLVLTVPPNNYDSLTYHLARAAAWVQHGGYYWIPNAPTDRLNVFQPLAEQQLLFLFTAFKTSRPFAVPQYLAELACLLAVYGASRRLGYGARVAVGSAALLATFSLVALESSTAQNDLVAASFPIVAACLILGGSRTELALAGIALALGLGAKLSTVFVWPVLALLLWRLGRRAWLWSGAGLLAGFVVAGSSGYWLNLVHTGHLLGTGFGSDIGSAPSLSAAPQRILHVLYRTLDVSTLSNRLIERLAVVGLAGGLVLALVRTRRAGWGRGALRGAAWLIPLAAPALVLAGAAVLAYLAKAVQLPVKVVGETDWNRRANEDYSAFGPVGTAMLLGTPVLAIGLYLARRVDVRHLALALTLPLFLLLLGIELGYNPFLTRFLLVPAVLTAPLFGLVLRSRTASIALLALSAIAVALTLEFERTKPYQSVAGQPWHLTELEALQYIYDPTVAPADAAYERLVPPRACVGAVLGTNEPSFLLFGRDLTRKVFYLPASAAFAQAIDRGVSYVVISVSGDAPVAGQFATAGWRIRPLGSYWLLATAPHPSRTGCI
jgi:hypothetical protein